MEVGSSADAVEEHAGKEAEMTETYGRTPTGQLLYDLVFTNIKPSTIKRKHKLSQAVEQIEALRNLCRKEAKVVDLARRRKARYASKADLEMIGLPEPGTVVRFLSKEEQEVMERALRRSVKLVKKGEPK